MATRDAGARSTDVITQRVGRSGGASRRLMGAVVAGLITVGVVGGMASPASAIAPTNSGRPGAVYAQRTAATYNSMLWNLNSGRFTVYRSPAWSGTQTVTIQWRVWSYRNGTWYLETAPSQTYTVLAGQYVGSPGWNYTDVMDMYATDARVTWRTSGGTFIASSFLDYVHHGDYQCNTPYPRCFVSTFGGQYGLRLV